MTSGSGAEQHRELSETVEVVATGLAGQHVWGPETLPPGTLIRTLRTHLMSARVLQMRDVNNSGCFCIVILDSSGCALKDEQTIEGPGPVAFTVVFRHFEPLAFSDRQRYKLLGVVARRQPDALGQLPDAAQADEEVVLEHIGWHAESFRYTNEALRYDPVFQCKAVAANWRVLQYADDVVYNDVAIVARSVEIDGLSLQFASEGLRDDKRLVLKAIASDSEAFKFASERLRADGEVVLAAIHQQENGHLFQYAMPSARLDREVVSAAVTVDPMALEHAGEVFRSDVDVALCGISSKNFSLSKCGTFLQMMDSSVLCNVLVLAQLENLVLLKSGIHANTDSVHGIVEEVLANRAKATGLNDQMKDQEEMDCQIMLTGLHLQQAKGKWSEESDED